MFDRTACVWGRIRARDHLVWALYHKRMNLISVYFLSSCFCLFHLGKKKTKTILIFAILLIAHGLLLHHYLHHYLLISPVVFFPVFICFSFISFHIVLIPIESKEVLNIAVSFISLYRRQ